MTFEIPEDRSKWEPYESPVKYCMVEQVPEICKLQFSFLIVSIVLVANLMKVVCIAWLLFRHKEYHALVTLGDALASFLERPDPHTFGRCLQSEVQIDRYFNGRSFVAPANDIIRYHNRKSQESENRPKEFKLERISWASAPSYRTWFATYMFYFGAVLFGIIACIWSLDGMPKSPAALWKIGFGSVDGRNLLRTNTSLIGGVLLANSPQAVLSYLYVAFNTLYTSMLIGKEWSSYMHERKALRVTTPVAQQRDTYWLSVPFRYAIPMTITSITVTGTTTSSNVRLVRPLEQISTCGFSPFAIILSTVTATVIAIGGIATGRMKYPAGMPMASSCSAAMSAACHPPPGDVDAHLLPVQWGAVTHGVNQDNEEVGHCSFSSWPIELPVPGRFIYTEDNTYPRPLGLVPSELHWALEVLMTCHRRRLVVTDTGFVGIATMECEIGDRFYILKGVLTPFALRDVQENATYVNIRQVKLIGDCQINPEIWNVPHPGYPTLETLHIV
ncbi:hypothetical protein EK21DRAFT_95204 [Setomelanomma holmii]|uniref:Uncharacterized protein n=1 Tax=Setomelanomma holmii TaxID=210430 RepID=A0A9P4GW59_9PLEO|nr:hypothetical protein EK21DRAFT_95204 [Setomelanomma holmii]